MSTDLQASTLDLKGFIITDLHPSHDDTTGGKADVTLMIPIRSNAEAASWEQSFVGAERCFNSRDALGDDDKPLNDHVLKLKFRDDARRLTLTTDKGEDFLSDKNCQLLYAELCTKRQAANVKIKLRVTGLTGELVGKVFDQIAKPILVHTSTIQQGLPFDKEKGRVLAFSEAKRSMTPRPGAFVIGILAADGSEFGGFVSEVYQDGDAEICKVVDLDGRVYPVSPAEVRSQHVVTGPKGKSADTAIAGLKDDAKERGLTLSYADLMHGLSTQYSTLPPGEAKVITKTVGAAALKACMDRRDAAKTSEGESEAKQDEAQAV